MCGLIAVAGSSNSALETFAGLMNLQHRGQDGAGILTVDSKKSGGFHLQKGSGLIENVFSERSFKNLTGAAAIGHARYATIGRDDPNLLQPFLDYETGIGLGHNGNIVNFYSLRDEILQKSVLRVPLNSDSALILKLITDSIGSQKVTTDSIFKAIKVAMDKLVGSYSIVCLTRGGDIFGFRDPNGIRPLVFGNKTTAEGDKVWAIASETIALNFLEYENIEEVKPGEAIYISAGGKVTRQMIKPDSYSPCMFEWVYFARVESEFGNQSVYEARFRLGLILAERIKSLGIEADIVVPVPETSRVAAVALAEGLQLPFRELLIKNRYINRTFILDGQQSRQEAIRRKLFPIAAEFKDKRCIIVDDSIVRGNTAKQIVRLIKQAGAKEVTLVSSCPPISNPCYYGIDFPSAAELVAHNKTEEEVAADLGCDRIVFQTVQGLKDALEQASLCTGCLTDTYPTDIDSGREFETRRLQDRNDDRALAPAKHSSC
ncbi:MAG: amidophosphoribosyltransferase [Cyanobacteria bacterium SZAS-4]|nr:amidophosphoribosyltransferase [Cyanobacteria bacterium SZAS-4]